MKQVKARARELKGNGSLTQKEGLKYLSRQNAGKFNIRQPKNIIVVTVNEEPAEERMAVGAEYVDINMKRIKRNSEMRKK